MSDPSWRPFTLSWTDRLPLDLSFLYEEERPAGKHGFLTVQGEHFAFEDGTQARFWGTNFNSGANFPPREISEMVARRLAKVGVNMVRFHQMDAEWSTPNLFTFNRARPKNHTRSFDAESLDRLDYLIHCLRNEGIYIYLDMLTYRQFLPGDEVEACEQLPQAAKPYHYFDPRLIERQKEFAHALWTHVNPYTGLAYKDDPAIALTEIVNESDPFVFKVTIEPYRTRLEERYRAWAAENGVLLLPDRIDFTHPDIPMAHFFVELMQAYYQQMKDYLHQIGVRIPICGTNWSINLGVTEAQLPNDFCDSHCYWNFPTWEDEQGTEPRPMVRATDTTLGVLSLMRLADRPFFVSEWDHAWPDPFRAESPLFYAAQAAFQGWGGCTIHTYRYSTWPPEEERIGGGAQTINGITYRNHFDTFNDPAKFGLFYQAALLLRRGDVQPAREAVGVHDLGDDRLLQTHQHLPALQLTAERHRLGILLPGQVEPHGWRAILSGETLVAEEAGQVLSDTDELGRNWQKGYGWIDTPRTQAVYGFLREAGELRLSSLKIQASSEFAVICLSSLSTKAIEEAEFLLLSAIGPCDNTEVQYSLDGRRQLSFGHAPVLMEPITASLALRTRHAHLKVWVISDHGEAVSRLPTRYHEGYLHFQIGPQPPYNPSTIYYLIRL